MLKQNAIKRKVIQKLRRTLFCILVLNFFVEVNAICREQHIHEKEEPSSCETLCHHIQKGNKTVVKCELRFLVLLPSDTSLYYATYHKVLPVLQLAKDAIKRQGLLPDYLKITFDYQDDLCSPSLATIRVMKGLFGDNCNHAILGPICDYCTSPVSRIVKYIHAHGTPIITPGAFSFDFERNKTICNDEYFMLQRVGMVSFKTIGKMMKEIMFRYNWNHAVFFYQTDGYFEVGGESTCHLQMQAVAEFFRKANITYNSFKTDVFAYNMTENLRREAGVDHSIIIMCANPSTIREIMLAADELNMVNSGDYVFFNIELFSSMTTTTNKPWYNESDTDERNERAKNAYSALLTVTARQPEDEVYRNFSNEVKRLANEKYNYTFGENETVSTIVTAFYDGVILYANALNDSIRNLGVEKALYDTVNGTYLTHLMWNRTFKGITGNVKIDPNGDRISDYSLYDMNPDTGYFELVANYYHDSGLTYMEDRQIHWAGGREEAPLDKPICGFDNSLCPDTSVPGYAILSIVLSAMVIVMALISFLGYRHYRLEAEINSMTWKVNQNEILRTNNVGRHGRGSCYSLAKRGSQLTMNSEEYGSIPGDRVPFVPIAFYKGSRVAIKKINVTNLTLNRSLMLELKKMKDLQHEHLVRFYGACLEAPEACILTEFCPKGSLQDILENEQIKLDWMFKLSLMHDIAKGMTYLHSTEIVSHGNLKSSNCVVDSRFVLKITDFGLHELRHPCGEAADPDSFQYWRRQLWTAPELLRLESNHHPRGTQKGDVYSFGIIIHEIITRQGPFYLGDDEKSPKEIIYLVKSFPKYMPPFRPKIDETAFEDINNIMVKCWQEEPFDRPVFSALKLQIRKINRENESSNILDNLLKRMEQYADNLEALVEERTQDYFEEKRKCEELLYQLLPKSIANQLISGKSVIAEYYEQVTIYFSDIVGFTSISAESTPMQVVDLLNDLYTCFDSIIENFDVYKVETIGDAYMVVSGLPVRNQNRHAREIGRMALSLLSAVYNFKIRHRPGEQLKLRIGLHTGPCVAGVVGLKMPRYCLFGDTVNTASRMESNGEPLKIHISHSTKEVLDVFGTFEIETRGLVKMKGKGDMLTFWLTGEKESEPLNNMIINGNNNILKQQNASQLDSSLYQSTNGNGILTNSATSAMPSTKRINNVGFNVVKTNNIKNQTFLKKMSNLSNSDCMVQQPLLNKN
uniref:Guanylate cyclase n=1 Tax=Culicoides sonorensis TaxID=179676 RepID=A0A336LM52_CULSO